MAQYANGQEDERGHADLELAGQELGIDLVSPPRGAGGARARRHVTSGSAGTATLAGCRVLGAVGGAVSEPLCGEHLHLPRIECHTLCRKRP